MERGDAFHGFTDIKHGSGLGALAQPGRLGTNGYRRKVGDDRREFHTQRLLERRGLQCSGVDKIRTGAPLHQAR